MKQVLSNNASYDKVIIFRTEMKIHSDTQTGPSLLRELI